MRNARLSCFSHSRLGVVCLSVCKCICVSYVKKKGTFSFFFALFFLLSFHRSNAPDEMKTDQSVELLFCAVEAASEEQTRWSSVGRLPAFH